MVVSIILATKNEEKNIVRCLKSIQHQTYPAKKIEVIIVDNNSSDSTRTLAEPFGYQIYNLPDIVNLHNIKNFRGAQLNSAVAQSSGDLILFPDTDMTFAPDLVLKAVESMKEGRVDAVYIPETIIGKGFFGKVRNFERSFYNMTCIDGVRIVTRKLYEKIGGFDEKNILFGPDDWDFTKMVKKNTDRLGLLNSYIEHHEELLDLKTYISKKSFYVNTFDDYIKKWGKSDPDIRKQFGFYYRFIGVFVEEGKWKKLLSHPMLTLGMFALRVLVGFQYIIKPFRNYD